MADVTINYKDAAIATMDASGTKTLQTQGKYCEDDITIAYVKPGGGGHDYLADALNNSLQSYSSADVISIRQYGFASCSVRNVSVPNAEVINAYSFSGCDSLQGIVLPSVKQVNGGSYIFNSCTALAYADFGENYATAGSVGIGVAFFQNCAALKTVILRTKTKVVPLLVATAFNGTPFSSGGSGGTIYLHKALYDHLGDGTALDYKAATNWSTVDGYGTITWAQIEGSIYETQYADGTPIT